MSVTKKKFSRKTKSSWRKYVNIKDVEDFLEEKRQEERIGSLSERKDDELFTIDNISSGKILSIKQKRRRNALKPPKNLSVFENTSKVPDPIPRRDRVKLRKNGRDLFEEVLNPNKSKRVLQSIEDRNKYYKKLEEKVSKKKSSKEFRDIWVEEDDPVKKQFLSNQWFTQNMALHNLKNIGKPVIKVHESAHHKTSLVRTFEPPHPGISYNPSLKDHQDLIQKVVEKEAKIIKEEQHLKRVTTDMFNKVTEEQRDSNQLAELSSGLPELEDTENNDEQNSDDGNNDDENPTYNSVNPPVEIKKKDKKARRKQKEEKERMKQMQFKKEQKKKVTDIHRLKHINEEVAKELESLNEVRKRRKLCKQKKKFEPKRISKVKYKEPEIDVNMAEDIAGNLRNVKNESSLLVDRFKDFQRRNILPPNVDLGPRKRRKVKRFVRSSHKEPEVAQIGKKSNLMCE